MAEKSSRFVILYASQTGNAEWIAKNIHQEALERGYVNECYVMEEIDKVCVVDFFFIKIYNYIIYVCNIIFFFFFLIYIISSIYRRKTF